MMSERLRTTATCRERIAVGTNSRLILRICSPKPGIVLSATASVASGVTSRGAGPVPPVVSTRWQPSRSTSSIRVDSIAGRSSGMRRLCVRQGLAMALANHSSSAGMPSSLYTPLEARSLIETSPISSSSLVAVIVGNLLRIRDDIAQRPEQLAIRSRRPARFALLTGVSHERTQALRVDARVDSDQRADRAVVLEQSLAPALDPVNARSLFVRNAVPDLELLADRPGVDRAHEPADVLQLAPSRLVLGNALRPINRIAQVLGQRHRVELL